MKLRTWFDSPFQFILWSAWHQEENVRHALKGKQYRMFQLKRKHNCYTWTPSRTKLLNQWQYWIMQPYPVISPNALFEIITAVISAVSSLSLCTEILLPVGLLLSYSAIPCEDTYSWMLHWQQQCSRWEVMFGNEHTLRSGIHHVGTCKTFAQLRWAGA